MGTRASPVHTAVHDFTQVRDYVEGSSHATNVSIAESTQYTRDINLESLLYRRLSVAKQTKRNRVTFGDKVYNLLGEVNWLFELEQWDCHYFLQSIKKRLSSFLGTCRNRFHISSVRVEEVSLKLPHFSLEEFNGYVAISFH